MAAGQQEIVDFGPPTGERKLKARHRRLRDAVRVSGKSISELLGDPFGGWPFLIQALINAKAVKPITLDDASDLIDDYRDHHSSIKGLAEALGKLMGDYVSLEATPTEDETAAAEATDTVPKGGTPDATGHSLD